LGRYQHLGNAKGPHALCECPLPLAGVVHHPHSLPLVSVTGNRHKAPEKWRT
jgi:hypothetical protein